MKLERAKESLFFNFENFNYLHKEFSRMFKKENFFAMFFYMKKYLNIDSSFAFNKYYL